jgi:hypothetical protein
MSVTVRGALLGTALTFVLLARPAQAGAPTKRDCVSASESAQDLRRAGRLREARAQFSLCAAASCPRAVRDDCAARLSEIDTAMPHLVLSVLGADRRPVASPNVVLDGMPVVDAADGTPIEVDPGAHRLQIRAEGLQPFEETVVIDEGDGARRVEVVLQPLAVRTKAPAAVVRVVARPVPTPPPADRGQQFAVGLALGGGGVAFLIAGSVLGLVAKSTYQHAFNDECGGNPQTCTRQGSNDGAAAHVDAAASTVAFVAGAALVAAGAVVVLTLPSGGRAAVGAMAGDGTVGMTVRGGW